MIAHLGGNKVLCIMIFILAAYHFPRTKGVPYVRRHTLVACGSIMFIVLVQGGPVAVMAIVIQRDILKG